MLQTDRIMIREMDQTDAQQFLNSVDDEDEMTGYLNALPEDVVQDALRNTNAVLDFVRTLSALRNKEDMKQYGAWNRKGELVACAGLTIWSTGTPELQITVAAVVMQPSFCNACCPGSFKTTTCSMLYIDFAKAMSQARKSCGG